MDLARRFGQPKAIGEWIPFLQEILEKMFPAGDLLQGDLQLLRQELDDMARTASQWNWHREVDAAVVRQWLVFRLGRMLTGAGFMARGVTFCAMLPMRSIPFKVICLLGMDHTSFPRSDGAPGFDLMARHPKPGDRSRRNDDKYLFLEALVSARRCFYVSYVGRSLMDNAAIPPSVLVSELTDYVQQAFGVDEEVLITHHPLQPFSAAYFKSGGRLFSYSRENCAACRSRLESCCVPRFFKRELLPPPPEWRHVDVAQLCRFYRNPCRFLMQRRLGIFLEAGLPEVADAEPFQLEPLTRYRLAEKMVARCLAGEDPADFWSVAKASGELPHGSAGKLAYQKLSLEVKALVATIEGRTRRDAPSKVRISLSLGDFELQGTIEGVYPAAMVRYRHGAFNAGDLLLTWINYLALLAGPGAGAESGGVLILKDGVWEFQPPEDPLKILETLLDVYWRGLIRPLPFFPASSHRYADKRLQSEGPPEKALQAARNRWLGSDFVRGESEDPYYRLCFPAGVEALDDVFQKIAENVYGPIFQHSRKMPF